MLLVTTCEAFSLFAGAVGGSFALQELVCCRLCLLRTLAAATPARHVPLCGACVARSWLKLLYYTYSTPLATCYTLSKIKSHFYWGGRGGLLALSI